MITKLYSLEEIPSSAQLLFTVGLLIIALNPILQLIDNTQQPFITGAVWFICGLLLISSFSSQRFSQQPIQLHKIIILVGLAAMMQSIDQIATVPLLSAYSFVFDLYALALLLRIENRKIALSTHWLIILYLFSIPEWGLSELIQHILQPTSTQLTWLISTAILLTTSMVIIRPSRWVSLLFIALFLVSCIVSQWLNNNTAITIVSLISMIVILIIGKISYRLPQKPHPFTDATSWVIPKALQNDGWWLEQETTQKKQMLYQVLSVIFVVCALYISL